MKLMQLLVFMTFSYPAILTASGDHGHKEDHDHGDGSIRISKLGLTTSNFEIKPLALEDLALNLEVNGYITTNQYQTSHLKPRYPGVVRKVFVSLGDKIQRNQKLAIIQANGSETNFYIKSSFSGTVIEKNIMQGQFVSTEHDMFTVSNLDRVWVQLSIPEHHTHKVKQGLKVTIKDWNGISQAIGKISFIPSTVHKDSQSMTARVEIDNTNGNWRPGLFVKASILTKTLHHALTIEKSAIQTLEEQQVVFLEKEKGQFIAQPVTLGLKNTHKIEVLAGLSAGDRYVSKNSYILKADFLKSEAGHEH